MASINRFRIRSFYIFIGALRQLKPYTLLKKLRVAELRGHVPHNKKKSKKKKKTHPFLCVLFAHDDTVHFTFVWGMMSVWTVLTQGYRSHFSPRNMSQLWPDRELNLLRQVTAI